MAWRLLHTPPLAGSGNMALDEALMERARRTGEQVLRVYAWREPTLSLGRNQRTAGTLDARRVAAAGVEVVRRPTGGRALLHDREVTYSVTTPDSGEEKIGAAYHRINLLLLHALARVGISAMEAVPTSRAPRPGSLPCFAEPSAGELVAGGRKLVGSAQWRDGGALLQHGSILLDDDQHRIPALMCVSAPPTVPPATLCGLLGRSVHAQEMAVALFAAVREAADSTASALDEEEESSLLREAADLEARYRDVGWTWRR